MDSIPGGLVVLITLQSEPPCRHFIAINSFVIQKLVIIRIRVMGGEVLPSLLHNYAYSSCYL